jgi:hypothetical protein
VWIIYYMGGDAPLIGGGGTPYAWTINFAANCALVAALPACGAAGDALGARQGDAQQGFRAAMQMGTLLMLALALPAFALVASGSARGAVLGQVGARTPLPVSVGYFSHAMRPAPAGLPAGAHRALRRQPARLPRRPGPHVRPPATPSIASPRFACPPVPLHLSLSSFHLP